MSETKHTPGPWSYDPCNRLVLADDTGVICDVLDTSEGLEGDCPEADANGCLLAAAPDLRKSCEDLLALVHDAIMHGMPVTAHVADVRNRAVAAIAKATGA